MHTDTPHSPRAPTITSARRSIRKAIRAIDSRWRTAPSDLSPGDARDRLLEPLVTCAGRVAEPGAIAHMHGVGMIAEAIALAAGWTHEDAGELRIHAALHDVGKLGISAAILTKPCPLTPRERESVERHPAIGQRLLAGASTPLLQVAARVAGEHHECWDGSGYPGGLAGDTIHRFARVIAIAHVFDALTSARPYRGPLPDQAALQIMERGRGTQFDPVLFDAFASVYYAGDPPCKRPAALIKSQESRWQALALRRAFSTALVIAALASASAATWRVKASSPRPGPGVPPSRPEPQPSAPIQLTGQTAAQSFVRAADRDLLATVRDRVGRGDPGVPATEVDRWILRFASDPAYRHGFEEALGRMTRYEPLIRQTLRRHRLPEELLYLVMVESEFRESAVSHAGATGMWQFMAPTGRLYDLEVSEYVDERRDPIRSTVAAAKHLRDLHVEFGSWHLALAAYNAGSGRVARAVGRRAGGRRGDERLYWQIRARLPRETQRYVPLYLAAAEIARRPRAFGLNPRPHPVLAFDEVWVPGGVTLDSVARAIGVATASVQNLNPHLVRGMTPPGRRWPVRIPPRLNASATLENSGR